MGLPEVAVFRTNNRSIALRRLEGELRKGRLRQGWGPPGTSLLQDDLTPVPEHTLDKAVSGCRRISLWEQRMALSIQRRNSQGWTTQHP